MTTVFDAAGKGSAKACWVLMRRARADRFESASAAAKPSPFHGVVFRNTKKPDMYWSAPRGAKRPVISALEIGYVRRSEVRCGSDQTAFFGRSERKEEENVKIHFEIKISRPLHPHRPRRCGADDRNRRATAGISAGFLIEPGWMDPDRRRFH